jgi:excisionase family DNA binding protein
MNGDEEPTMLTLEEAAKKLTISVRSLRRLIAAGTIDVWKPSPGIVRVRQAEVLRVLNGPDAEPEPLHIYRGRS